MLSLLSPLRSSFAFAVASLVLVVGSPAGAQVRIAISGEVAPVCRVNANLSNGAGQMQEFCNVPAGYDVYLDAPGAQNASVTVDGTSIPLSSTGSTLVSSSDGPAIRTRTVSIAALDGVSPATFTFRIVSR